MTSWDVAGLVGPLCAGVFVLASIGWIVGFLVAGVDVALDD